MTNGGGRIHDQDETPTTPSTVTQKGDGKDDEQQDRKEE